MAPGKRRLHLGEPVGKYVLTRSLQGLLTLWLVTVAVFFLVRLTGNPINFLVSPEASPEDRQRLIEEYGFDKSYWEQYVVYNKNFLQGKFGESLRWDSRDGFEVFIDRLPATIQLTLAAMIFSIVVGVTLGVLSATNPDSLFDRVGKVVAILGQSMPVFWVGILMILVFAVYFKVLPAGGSIERLGWKAIVLPAVTLGWLFVAAHMRIVRSSMLEVLDSEYIKMIRAKGLPRRLVIWKHALKNASIPIFTLFMVNFAQLISGAVVTETIFGWPGIGRLLVDSIFVRDFAVAQTVVFFGAGFIVAINLTVDIIYGLLDPRIRVAQ